MHLQVFSVATGSSNYWTVPTECCQSTYSLLTGSLEGSGEFLFLFAKIRILFHISNQLRVFIELYYD